MRTPLRCKGKPIETSSRNQVSISVLKERKDDQEKRSVLNKEDKFKQWDLNNIEKLNEIKKVRQEDLRKANIMIFGRIKNLS